ncbi:MAG: YqiA/YcfP family alpha/beta fold hydrolase [Gammaproteobacteria bacterium]
MILYIHGFGSCGSGNKVDALRAEFGEKNVLSPDLPVSPKAAMALLESLIAEHDIELLVGSSLGGFYAEWLNGRHGIPSVLINPSTRPQETLARYLGENTHWCTGERYQWTPAHIEELAPFARSAVPRNEHYLVLLQTDDEVLNYRLAEQRYARHEVVIEQGGNHRFENLEDYATRILDFLTQTRG